MAFTVILALIGSLIFAVAAVPTLAFWFAKIKSNQEETWLLRSLRTIYQPILRFSMSKPLLAAGSAIGLFIISLFAGTSLGGRFYASLG